MYKAICKHIVSHCRSLSLLRSPKKHKHTHTCKLIKYICEYSKYSSTKLVHITHSSSATTMKYNRGRTQRGWGWGSMTFRVYRPSTGGVRPEPGGALVTSWPTMTTCLHSLLITYTHVYPKPDLKRTQHWLQTTFVHARENLVNVTSVGLQSVSFLECYHPL